MATPVLNPHPRALWLLKFLLLFLGLTALVSGLQLILDPSGKSIQFPEGYLEGAPFRNYFIPGVLLAVFMGLLPLTSWYALWKKPDDVFLRHLNPFRKQHWAWTMALTSGVALMVWIAVQVTMVPYFFLQPLMMSWGALIVLLCLLPGVKAYYRLQQSEGKNL